MWIVDTCVVLDVFENDPQFGEASAKLLENLLPDGLAVAAVTFVAAAPLPGAPPDMAGTNVAQVGATLVGAALVARGVLALRGSRLNAYHWFVRGLLVWILITQVFVFYSSQLGGLGGLAVDLVAYGSLRYAIGRERAVQRAAASGRQSGSAGHSGPDADPG